MTHIDEDEEQPTKTRPGDQRLPDGSGECVQDHIIEEMARSKSVGLARYGTPLRTFNGRRGIVDVQEEARDLFVYLTQLKMESEASRREILRLVQEEIIERFVRGGEEYEPVVVAAFAHAIVDRIYGHFSDKIAEVVAARNGA